MSGFITLEGPDGSGKSTQARLLAEHLEAKFYNVLLIREPGSTPIGQQVRQVLMDMQNTTMMPETEFLLFSAARAQLVREVIRPHLDKNGVVICDRFYDSSLAYQGYGHGLDLKTVEQVTEFATGGLQPDLTLLLDVDPEIGLQRRQVGEDDWTRLDNMVLAFHRRAREGFKALAAREPWRWVVLDAGQPIEIITTTVTEVVDAWLTTMHV